MLGKNPFDYAKTSGSLQLSPEKVLYEAMDADYWLIRFAYTPLTLATLQSDRAMYGKFKAFKMGMSMEAILQRQEYLRMWPFIHNGCSET